jgi:hypothetical protein
MIAVVRVGCPISKACAVGKIFIGFHRTTACQVRPRVDWLAPTSTVDIFQARIEKDVHALTRGLVEDESIFHHLTMEGFFLPAHQMQAK